MADTLTGFIPYRPERYPPEQTAARATVFYEMIRGRRSVRQFSPELVARTVIEDLIRAAGGPGDAHPHPQPDGLPLPRTGPSHEREAVRPDPGRLRGAGGHRAGFSRRSLEKISSWR